MIAIRLQLLLILLVSTAVPAEMKLTTNREGNLFTRDETIIVSITGASPREVVYRLENLYGETVEKQVPVKEGRFDLRLDGLKKKGYLLLTVSDVERSAEAFIAMGLVDPPRRLPADYDSYFGINSISRPETQTPGLAYMLHQLSVRTIFSGLPIRVIAPSPTERRWPQYLDDYVNALVSYGITAGFKINRIPEWLGEPLAGARDLPAWRELCREVAAHFKGRIKFYVFPNEPEGGGYWKGTPTDYANLMIYGGQGIRAADPEALLVGPEIYSGGFNRFARKLLRDIPDYVDVISTHYTLCYEHGTPESYWMIMDILGIHRPVWDSEAQGSSGGELLVGRDDPFAKLALGESSDQDPADYWVREQAEYGKVTTYSRSWHFPRGAFTMSNAKSIVYHMAQGVDKFFGFCLNNPRYRRAALLTPGNLPKPGTIEFRAVSDELEGAYYLGPMSSPTPKVSGFFFQKNDETILVLWTNEYPLTMPILIPTSRKTFTLVDCQGNSETAQAKDGKLRIDVSYPIQYVHGLEGMRLVEFPEVTASPGWFQGTGIDNRVHLAWEPLPGAQGYHLYRSETPEERGERITKAPLGDNYFSEALPQDRVVQYSVTAVDGKGTESEPAADRVLVTPAGVWMTRDVSFKPVQDGVTAYTAQSAVLRDPNQPTADLRMSTLYTELGGSADSFRYCYKKIIGDFDVKTRASIQNLPTAESTLMVRRSLRPDDLQVSVMVGRNKVAAGRRVMASDDPHVIEADAGGPTWVRVARKGNIFEQLFSVNGRHWTKLESDLVKAWREPVFLGQPAYVGLAISAPWVGAFSTVARGSFALPDIPAESEALIPPTFLEAEVSSGGIKLSWSNSSPGFPDIEIERRQGSGEYEFLARSRAATEYADRTAKRGVCYSYRVRAIKGGAFSECSRTVSIVR